MSKPHKKQARRTQQPEPQPKAQDKPQQQARPVHGQIISSPQRLIEHDRKTSIMTIDTLAKTALTIASGEGAADKVAVIQSLWGMQKEAEDRQAEREFNIAKVAVAMALPAIPKTKTREFVDKLGQVQSSKYADLDDIEGVLDPICRANGITKEYTTKTVDGKACQVCIVRHVSGHKEVYESPYMPLDTTGSKNNNQAAGSTAKYGRRYALIGAFNIYHVDEDTDGALPTDGSPKPDKFAARVEAEAQAQAPKGQPKLSLEEAAAALESRLRNMTMEKRGEYLMRHIEIVGNMEKDEKLAAKAKELRELCVPKTVEGQTNEPN